MAQITVEQPRPTPHHHHSAATRLSIENQKFATWLYLASEVVLFSILIAGYMIFRIRNTESVLLVQETLGVTLVSVNTFILLASSFAMVMGLRAIEMGNRQGFYQWIGITALLGTLFLGGQFIEYSELRHLGINLQSSDFSIETPLFEEQIHIDADGDLTTVEFLNPERLEALGLDEVMIEPAEGEPYSIASKFDENGVAQLNAEEFELLNSTFVQQVARSAENFGGRFYTPTAFHGLHVLIGVLWALLVLWRGSRGRYDQNAVGVEVFGLYWHFVDVVWILLFTLIYLI